MIVSDFDENGDQDLATGHFVGTVMVHPGNGDGTFGTGLVFQASRPLISGVSNIALGDFDGDGHQDVAATLFDADRVSVLLNQTGVTPAGAVPDGSGVPGTPLTVVEAGGGNITLMWGASCASSDTDYAIYEGTLGDFTSHAPVFCTAGGATKTFTPDGVSTYYLVVPRNDSLREGSYGLDSIGSERPPSNSPCLAQKIATTCP